MIFRKLILICAFTIVVNNVNLVAPLRSSYGEACSRTQKCDKKGWLSCYEGKCDCSKPDEMLYDQAKGKCVTKSGERCKFGVEESGESSLVEITDCVSHSICSADGICNCESQYHEIFNGTCAKSKSFGDNCTEEEKCSKFEQLECFEGNCQCKEGDSVYSFEEKQCVGLVNKMCVKNKCEKTTQCQNGICKCDDDHYDDSGKCPLRKGALESCTKDTECTHKNYFVLKCYNGRCNCEEGTVLADVPKSEYVLDENYLYNEYYRQNPESYMMTLKLANSSTTLCAPLYGKNCNHGYCATNSYCAVPSDKTLSSDKYDYGTCQCLGEYSLDEEKSICGKPIDQSCNTNQDCFNHLECNEGVCKCPSPISQIKSSDGKYCLTKIGGSCSSEYPCVENAFCEFLSDSQNEVGHCKCSEGFLRNHDGTCDSGFGKKCSYNAPSHYYNGIERHNCDKVAGLICLNQKCSCPDKMMEHSETKRKCLLRVGGPCSRNEECIENAHCIGENLYSWSPSCVCNSGFEETTNLTCVLVGSQYSSLTNLTKL